MRSVHTISHKLLVVFAVLSSKKLAGCNPIINSNFNDHIRDFSLIDDNINSTSVKTLQKEEPRRYGNFTPIGNPVRFKEASDNALSSSSYSRGLLLHELPGYDTHYYEGGPPPSYGHEYHIQDVDHGHHGFNHYSPDHYHSYHDGHHHVNYHHKHYDHALAAKTVLWPIAGIALLGAAAALVSNPILLQLGVVSGRRKRRDTEETFESNFDTQPSWLRKKDINEIEAKPTETVIRNRNSNQSDKIDFPFKVSDYHGDYKNRLLKNKHSNTSRKTLLKRLYPTVQPPVKDQALDSTRQNSSEIYQSKLIPIPLLIKQSM